MNPLERAWHVYQFIVDLSEVNPVKIGLIRHWDIY